MMPVKKHRRDENTLISTSNTSPSEPTANTSSIQTATTLNIPAKLITKRKSWADVLRLPAEQDVAIESAMASPSEYFDAKQSPRSSPETSGPSKESTPTDNKKLGSIELTPTHSRTEPATSSSSSPGGQNVPKHAKSDMSTGSNSSGKSAKSTKLRKSVVISPSAVRNAPRGKKNKNIWRKRQVTDQLPSTDSSRTVSPKKDENNGKNEKAEQTEKSYKTEQPEQAEENENLPNYPSADVEALDLGKVDEQPVLPVEADSPSIVENLRSQFGNPAYSDIQILVGSQESQHVPNFGPGSNYEVFYVHMPILHLSPFMRQMIQAKAYGSNDGLRYIHVICGSSFNLIPAFSMALQYLYSTPLITTETIWEVVLSSANHGLVYGKTVSEFQPGIAMVHFSLCYAVSGVFLNLHEVTKRGMELAHGLLAWNTVELFLRFGMASSAYMLTCPELCDELISSLAPSTSNAEWPPKVSMSHITEFNEKWPGLTTNLALEFIASAITADFVVYERAQSRFAPSRIPGPLWTLPNSQCSDPGLESIKFGSFPSYAETAPTDEAVLVTSAMLLTLPFSTFAMLLAILKRRGAARMELISEAVHLREARRLQAVRQYQDRVWPPGTLYEPGLEELAYREAVVYEDLNATPNTDIPQASVMRVWVGLSHPKMEALKRAHEEETKEEE
jgi:hypothetical protein